MSHGAAKTSRAFRMAVRAYGPFDGPVIWLARIVQRRIGYRWAWPLWEISNRYENWRFHRMLRKHDW